MNFAVQFLIICSETDQILLQNYVNVVLFKDKPCRLDSDLVRQFVSS